MAGATPLQPSPEARDAGAEPGNLPGQRQGPMVNRTVQIPDAAGGNHCPLVGKRGSLTEDAAF
jgi:hypothetical protein